MNSDESHFSTGSKLTLEYNPKHKSRRVTIAEFQNTQRKRGILRPNSISYLESRYHTRRQRSLLHILELEKLEDSLEEYYDSVQEESKKTLEANENDLKESVNIVASRVDQNVQTLIKAEEILNKPLLSEILRVGISSNDPTIEAELQDVSIHDRMIGFEKLVTSKRKELDELWNKWTDNQTDLIQWVVEIVGLESLGFRENETSTALDDLLQQANHKHLKICEQYEQAELHLGHFETQITEIAKKAKEDMKSQQKACTIAKKKNIDKLKKAMELLQAASS